MGAFARHFQELGSALMRRAETAAPEQAGIFAGVNPATYDPSDPIKVWIIQLIVIIAMTQLLATIGSQIRQPRVIAEVIGGVLLGPSVMGHIPGFSNAIFPTASLANLTLTANIGLVLFLFLIGLEVDVRLLKRNVRSSMAISAAGLIIPLGLGAALAIPIYHEFIDPGVKFGQFVLFVAVAIGITAFPVLCRILTATRLLDTTVGVVVLSAGVGNDVVGWILLALTVALVNSGSGLDALWILLTAAGYTIFLLFPVKWAFRWAARRSGSLENGKPTLSIMTLTMILVFFSAFFTDIIGVHPIFGGFLAGLVIPHDNGLAIAILEKIEDIVAVVFLPLYFALSGLKTNLGTLNTGKTWGYTILIIVVAFFSKFLGCFTAAKLTGFNLRESGAVGVLMSCKGLVELIVLNVGLSANILDTRTFSMFVLHALVVTFMTTPLVLWILPEKYRTRDGPILTRDLPAARDNSPQAEKDVNGLEDVFKSRFAVVLEKMEELPAVMTIMQLLRSSNPHAAAFADSSSNGHEKEKGPEIQPELSYDADFNSSRKPVSIQALRLIELTERTSDVLKSQESASLVQSDPLISVVRTFGYLNKVSVSSSLNILPFEEFPHYVAKHVKETSSQLVILPWSGTGEDVALSSATRSSPLTPFEKLFGNQSSGRDTAVVHTQFIRRVFNETPADVALFIDHGLSESYPGHSAQRIFLPFFGGQDDRLALSFVVQLCMNPSVSATVVRFNKVDTLTPNDSIEEEKAHAHQLHALSSPHNSAFPDTIYGARDTQTRLASDTADNMLWDRFTRNFDPEVADAVNRIVFSSQSSTRPLHSILEVATAVINQYSSHSRVMVAVGRSRRMAVESHSVELRELFSERGVAVGTELPKTLGDVGAAFASTNANTSLLVLQACNA